jgi:hypothetical protein
MELDALSKTIDALLLEYLDLMDAYHTRTDSLSAQLHGVHPSVQCHYIRDSFISRRPST